MAEPVSIQPITLSKDELDSFFTQLSESGVDSPSAAMAQEISTLLSKEHPELITYQGLRQGTAPFFDTLEGLKDVPPEQRRLDDAGIMEAFLVNPDGQPMRRGDFWKGFKGEIAPQAGSFAGAYTGAKAGMAMQAGIPPVGPPAIAAKFLIPTATTLLGAVIGQEGIRAIQREITGEEELITPGTTPAEEAGKTAATVAGFLATPWALSKNLDFGASTYLNNVRNFVGPRTAEELASKVGRERSVRFISGIERLLSKQAQTAQKSTTSGIMYGASEVGAGAGMTGGAYFAETEFPGELGPRLLAETAGAVPGGAAGTLILGPAAILVKNLDQIGPAIKQGFETIREKGLKQVVEGALASRQDRRMLEGADKIRELIEASPEENLDEIIRRLAEIDPNLLDVELTAGAKTGSPVLLSIEEAINSIVPSVGAQRDAATDQAVEALRNALLLQIRSGTGRETLKESAELFEDLYKSALANRLSGRTEDLLAAFERVGTDRSNQELSQALFDIVDQQLSLARREERRLWSDIPQYTIDLAPGESPQVITSWLENMPTTPEAADAIESALKPLTRFIQRKTDELGLGVAEEGEALSPSLQQALDGVEPGTLTSTELVEMRSAALNLARKLSADGLYNEARIASDFATAALQDLENIADASLSAAYQGARAYSRSLNDVFTRGLAGDILQTTRQGGQRQAPELLAQTLLRGNADPVQLRFQQVQEIGRFGLGQDFIGPPTDAAVATMQDLDTVYEAIIRNARSAALTPGAPLQEGGKINQAALNRWMTQNDDLLRQFPGLRADLSDLNTAQTLFNRTAEYNKRKAAQIKNAINFQNLMGKNADSPVYAVAQALSSGNRQPMQSLRNLARVANQAPENMRASAREGLQQSVLQWAMESAGMNSGRFSPEVMNEKLFGPIPKSSGSSVMDWMVSSNLISSDEAKRTQKVLAQMLRYERAAKGGALEQLAEESGPMFDLFLRITGAKLGTMGSEMLGGGSQSLIAAGAGSQALRNVFSNMPNVLNMDVMSQLIKDPKLLADFLARPKSEREKLKIAGRVKDWFGSQGITLARRPAPTALREYTDELFEEVVPQPEPPEQPVSEAEPRTEVQPPLAASDVLWNRVLQQESGNRQTDSEGRVLRSRAGAIGISQVMPSTAMDPGYGVPSIFDMARQNDIRVGEESLQEAERLLGIQELNEQFGRAYFDMLARRYEDDPVRQLIAYNAGIRVADSYNDDPSTLPRETQGYIANILGVEKQPVRQAAAPAPKPPIAQAAPPAPPTPAPVSPQSLQRAAQVLGPQDEIGMLASELLMRQRPV